MSNTNTNTTPANTEVSVPNRKDGVMAFAPAIMTGDWKNWDVSVQVQFVTEFGKAYAAIGNLRSTLDSAIWAGHEDGSVDSKVKSIRKQREGDKPGRKAAVKTLEQRLGLAD